MLHSEIVQAGNRAGAGRGRRVRQQGRLAGPGQRQYSRTAGQTENCQAGVFLAHASACGQALLDRELYLPRSWADDPDRCREACVPQGIPALPEGSRR